MSDQRVPKPYEVEVAVSVGRDRTWEAVTRPDVLRQWFGWDYSGLDEEIQHIFVNEASLLAPERLGWADGSYLEVTGDEARSVVRAVREGPVPRDPDKYDAIEETWKSFLIQLCYLLDQSPQGTRRTLLLTGTATGRQALGLAKGDWERVGERVAWTIDPNGHLVVVASREHLDKPVAGSLEVVVSMYGVPERAFQDFRKEWTKRWSPIAREALVTYGNRPAPGD